MGRDLTVGLEFRCELQPSAPPHSARGGAWKGAADAETPLAGGPNMTNEGIGRLGAAAGGDGAAAGAVGSTCTVDGQRPPHRTVDNDADVLDSAEREPMASGSAKGSGRKNSTL